MDIKLNPRQKYILSYLENIANFFNNKYHKNNIFLKNKFFLKRKYNKFNIKSLYIYGNVGRGKTMLANIFLNKLQIDNKITLHFHDLMIKTHKLLHKNRNNNKIKKYNIFKIIVKNIIKDNIILIIDEFEVNDIADASILSKLFTEIFNLNIIVIFTSNFHPLKLYNNGLQRELFLNFINNNLLKNVKLLSLEGNIDYRTSSNIINNKFFYNELDNKNKKIFLEKIAKITNDKKKEIFTIKSFGRKIEFKIYDNIAIFDFNYIFSNIFAKNEYKIISEKCNIIFINDFKKIESNNYNIIKKIIYFIDYIYLNNVKLYILSDVEFNKILPLTNINIDQKTAILRCISRLKEILFKNN